VGGGNIGEIVVHMVLLWEVATGGELLYKWCYFGREQYLGNCGAYVESVGGSNIGGNVEHMVLLWLELLMGELW
jgi:hypothetical protein